MNKKNLSVVMAGAMLATSVAPVLADTTEVKKYEVSKNNLGLLKSELRKTMDSKKYVSTDTGVLDLDNNLDGSLDGASSVAGESVYYITVNEDNGSYVKDTKTRNLEVLNGLTPGAKVTLWNNGYREENGKYYSKSNGDVNDTTSTFKLADLKTAATELADNGVGGKYSKVVKEVSFDEDAGTLEVTFKSVDDSFKNITATYKVGDTKVDFDKVLSKDGVTYHVVGTTTGSFNKGDLTANEPSGSGATGATIESKDVAGFAPLKVAAGSDIAETKVAEITVVEDAKNTLLVSDLYDGTMLTDKGYEILAGLKESYTPSTSSANATGITVYNAAGSPTEVKSNNISTDVDNLAANADTGVVTMEISYTDEYGTKHEYTVRGTDLAEAKKVATWLASQNPVVDVLAGDNRYETAVSIAKEAFGNDFKLEGTATTTAQSNKNNRIVLVNGTALVDGLAAAPYAKAITSANGGGAPILLSDTNALPKATKDYLEKITEDVAPANMKNIEVHLVGGESVLSDSLKKELKDMGFTVKRIAGDDREETSIAVAKATRATGASVAAADKAFLVGATGEADAMSIAAVASDKTVNGTSTKVVPIVVAGVHGLSEDAMEYLSTSDTTVIGGTAQISNEEYKALNEANDSNTVNRIAGENRQATNAAIIKEYYSKNTAINTKSVVIAKDGMNNKTELVDALGASTLASKLGAPIVLGTNKLSDAQVNEIELADSTNASAIYQVGHGVSKDIVKTLVKKFGL